MTASRADRTALLLALLIAAAPAAAQDAPIRIGPPQRLGPPPAQRPADSLPMPLPPPEGAGTPSLGTPSGEGGPIRVAPLAPIDPAWMGTLDEATGALPPTLWQGTPRSFVAAVLPRLPATTSPALQDLSRRLLLSSAVPPGGTDAPDKPGLVALRLERLVAIGRVEPAQQVLDNLRTRRDEATDRLAVELKLLQNDRSGACALVNEGVKTHQGAWWDRALVACQAMNGEHAKAALGLTLLREQKAPKDDLFDALVSTLGGRAPHKLPPLSDPSPLHLALLRAANLPVPAELANTPKPAMLRSIALDPEIPAGQRLNFAEHAAAYGAISPAQLRDLYTKLEFSQDERSSPLTRAQAEKGARGRAVLLEAARAQPSAAARAELLRAYLEHARAAGVWPVAVRTAEPVLVELRPTPELGWFAGEATRAMLLLHKGPEATAWFGAADPETARDLLPVMRIALGRGTPRWDQNSFGAAADDWAKRDAAAGARQAVLALGLLAALDEPVGPGDWAPLVASAQPASLGPAPAPIWLDLPRAAAGKRVGETILLSTIGMTDGDRLTPNPVALAETVEALKAVGLEHEARDAAVEAALAAGI